MEDKELNPADSLKLINSMIDTAKNKLADDGFYFILWGWLVTVCAMVQYFSVKLNIEYGHLVWAILLPIGGVVSGIYGRKENKTKKVKTYIDTYLTYLWSAVLTGMALALVFQGWNGFHQTYFFLIIIYGIGSLITGGLLNFKPLVFGSLFSFAFATLSVFVNEIDLFPCISGALLFSHIIPGHLLRSKFKSENV